MPLFYNISAEDPDGIKILDNPTKTLKALIFPRTCLLQFSRMKESKQAGVYILYNTTDMGSKPHIYIGQSSIDITSRLNSHNRSKEFWNHAMVFVEKGDFLNLNGTHAKMIEAALIEKARDFGVVVLDNDTGSNIPRTTDSDRYAAATWTDEIISITKLLGLPFFKDIQRSNAGISDAEGPNRSKYRVIPTGMYYMERKIKRINKTVHAELEVKDSVFIVKAGSEIAEGCSDSADDRILKLREEKK